MCLQGEREHNDVSCPLPRRTGQCRVDHCKIGVRAVSNRQVQQISPMPLLPLCTTHSLDRPCAVLCGGIRFSFLFLHSTLTPWTLPLYYLNPSQTTNSILFSVPHKASYAFRVFIFPYVRISSLLECQLGRIPETVP